MSLVISKDFGTNPTATTFSWQGALQGMITLPVELVRPSNWPEESLTVAPGSAALRLSSTVMVTGAADCASSATGERIAPISASMPIVIVQLEHRMRFAFGIGE